MKFRNIQELQEIAVNHSSDANFKDFMKLFKKCFPKPDNILLFRKNLLEQK